MASAREFSTNEVLRNGMGVTVRAVRSDDRERIRRAFAGLERDSVYRRYLAFKKELTDRELNHIDVMDFVNEVMLVASISAGKDEVIIGTGRYVAHEAADGVPTAEVAFTVEEDFQGIGLAGRLLGHLAAIARDNGFKRLDAEVFAENKGMLKVFGRCGLPMVRRLNGDIVHIDLDLGRA